MASGGWIDVTLRLLSLAERILPSVLLAWVARLTKEKNIAELKLSLLETRNETRRAVEMMGVEDEAKTARDSIDDFLRDTKGDGSGGGPRKP